MRDAISATLSTALDAATDVADALRDDRLPAALDAAAARQAALAEAGIQVQESPYLHFLRRFAGEAAPTALAASA